MPKRSEKRDTAKAAYIARKAAGEEVSLRELAQEQGVSYQTPAELESGGQVGRSSAKEAAGRSTGKPQQRRKEKTLPEAMRAHRREIRTQKRTERTAPSFLICSRTQSGRSYSKRRWEAAPRWSMKCKS